MLRRMRGWGHGGSDPTQNQLRSGWRTEGRPRGMERMADSQADARESRKSRNGFLSLLHTFRSRDNLHKLSTAD
jgi:hypothetical protein